MKAQRFEVTFLAEDGIFPNVYSPVRGCLKLSLKKPLDIRYLMVGWSTKCNSQEVTQGKTRVGKQIYIEKVQYLVGGTDSKKLHYMEAKEHVFQFEIQNHEMNDSEELQNTIAKFSWHNFKAALVDENEAVYYADIIAFDDNSPVSGSNEIQSGDEADTNELIDINSKAVPSGNLSSRAVKKQSHHFNGNEGINYKQRDIDVQCLLHKPCFTFQEIIAFTIQCRNNSKKGFRHLTATLIERRTKKEKGRRSSKVVASIVGPAVAPKEIVIWDGQLMPLNIESDTECWYKLKVELKNKFSTKFIIRVPVVITDSPLTPT